MPGESDPSGGVGPRKPSFSQRHGYTEHPTEIQTNSLDERTRTDLWNFVIHTYCVGDPRAAYEGPHINPELVWMGHLGHPTHRYHFGSYVDELHDITFNGEWYRVFDLLEFLVQNIGPYRDEQLAHRANGVLALNRAGHRIADRYIVPVTNPAEISSIEAAAESPLADAREHIKRALAQFAVRENPNFAKTIQEAMSAAEAAASVLAYKPGSTLSDALKAVQKRDDSVLHPALIEAWKMLYGFTGDSGGIRHALKEGTTEPGQDLAQYFIITCSAFVNLVAAIVARRG